MELLERLMCWPGKLFQVFSSESMYCVRILIERSELPIVDQKSGRVGQLLETSNMKFIAASRFSEQGRRAAVADGFIPIEIGFKVDESNAIEAYGRVYEVMNKVFTTIAPKRLQQLAEAVARYLKSLGGERGAKQIS